MKYIADDILDRLVAGAYKGPLQAELLHKLAAESPAHGLEACKRMRAQDGEHLEADRLLARLEPGSTVDSLLMDSTPSRKLLQNVAAELDVRRLDLDRLFALTKFILREASFVHDPPIHSADFHPTDPVRKLRGDVLQQLADLGQSGVLQDLLEASSEPEYTVLLHYLRIARKQKAERALRYTTPQGLLDILSRTNARFVKNDVDLLHVIVDLLERLQHDISSKGSFRDLWNFEASGAASPKSEDDISDWVKRQFELRLSSGVVIDREIQVERAKAAGLGTRIDLTASTITATRIVESARVIVEAKLVGSAELMTALKAQLVERYLIPTERRAGIFLVYWVSKEQRPQTWRNRTIDEKSRFLEVLTAQAKQLSGTFMIIPVLLDISRPSGS